MIDRRRAEVDGIRAEVDGIRDSQRTDMNCIQNKFVCIGRQVIMV